MRSSFAAGGSLRGVVLFVVVSVLWGSTWIALKVGLALVPPLFFAGTRFVAAGAVLMALRAARGGGAVARGDWGLFAVLSVLMIALPYGLLFWGTQYTTSGLSAVLNLGVLPIAMVACGALAGQDRLTRRRVAGVVVGVLGLAILFGPKLAMGGGRMEVAGGVAIVGSALVYAVASVAARPVLGRYSPTLLSAWTMVLGGVELVGGSALFERVGGVRWGVSVWEAWGFLVIFGSVVAYTAFLELVRLWGVSRAATYAFVSPVVAVGLGVGVFGEMVTATDGVGMVVMLVGAWLTMGRAGLPAAEA